MLRDEQLRAFGRDGYVVVPEVVDEVHLEQLDAEVDGLIARQPPPAGKVGFHHYTGHPSSLPVSNRVLRESGALALAGELVAPLSIDLAFDHIQLATSIPGWDHRPGGGHIDGYVRDETGVEIDASGVSGAHLSADPDHLARAVRNLLTNAAHHARERITVMLREDGGRVRLVVADDGVGVPEDQRERVFERFARLDDARSRGEGGTGLGLAITRDIVEAHDGVITCGEAVSGGARFEIDLPGAGQIAEP